MHTGPSTRNGNRPVHDEGIGMMKYSLYVNRDSTIMVRFWENGRVEVCTRPTADHIWSAPIQMDKEPV